MQNSKKKWLALSKMTYKFSRFSPEHVRKSENWNFDGVLLSKVENVWAWNLQGIFGSWQLRMTQNVKRNWLVSLKLTWGLWRILTRALENLKKLHFNGLLLNKVYNIWDKKKSVAEFCLMALNIDATFGGKLNCAFKNDMRNLASIFSAKHVWKSKNWDFDEILLSKVENVWASNLQGSFVSWKWRICRSKNYRSRSKKYAWSKNYIRSENYICKLKNHFPIE